MLDGIDGFSQPRCYVLHFQPLDPREVDYFAVVRRERGDCALETIEAFSTPQCPTGARPLGFDPLGGAQREDAALTSRRVDLYVPSDGEQPLQERVLFLTGEAPDRGKSAQHRLIEDIVNVDPTVSPAVLPASYRSQEAIPVPPDQVLEGAAIAPLGLGDKDIDRLFCSHESAHSNPVNARVAKKGREFSKKPRTCPVVIV